MFSTVFGTVIVRHFESITQSLSKDIIATCISVVKHFTSLITYQLKWRQVEQLLLKSKVKIGQRISAIIVYNMNDLTLEVMNYEFA